MIKIDIKANKTSLPLPVTLGKGGRGEREEGGIWDGTETKQPNPNRVASDTCTFCLGLVRSIRHFVKQKYGVV